MCMEAAYVSRDELQDKHVSLHTFQKQTAQLWENSQALPAMFLLTAKLALLLRDLASCGMYAFSRQRSAAS